MIHEVRLDREDLFAVQMKRAYRRRYEERLPELLRAPREMTVLEPVGREFAFMSGTGWSDSRSEKSADRWAT